MLSFGMGISSSVTRYYHLGNGSRNRCYLQPSKISDFRKVTFKTQQIKPFTFLFCLTSCWYCKLNCCSFLFHLQVSVSYFLVYSALVPAPRRGKYLYSLLFKLELIRFSINQARRWNCITISGNFLRT